MMRIYTYISLPGLLIHEMMHIIFGFLSGYIFSLEGSWIKTYDDGSMTVGLEPKNKGMNLFQMIMVPMAPLYFIVGLAILSIWNPVFIAVIVYFLITYVYSLPSNGDYEQLKYAKVYMKYNFADPVFIRFMNAKGNGITFMSNVSISDPEE